MKIEQKALLLAVFLAVVTTGTKPATAQILSPPERATCKFGDGKTIAVRYSSPRMRGRKIFGDVVPFGEVWRAGADDATSFVTNVDVTAPDFVKKYVRYLDDY